MRRGGVRYQRAPRRQRRPRQEATPASLLFQIAPLIIILGAMLLMSTVFRSDPLFSLYRTHYYNVRQETANGIVFYAASDDAIGSGVTRIDVERSVESAWARRKMEECHEQQVRKDRLSKSWFSPSNINQYPTPACDEIAKFRRRVAESDAPQADVLRGASREAAA